VDICRIQRAHLMEFRYRTRRRGFRVGCRAPPLISSRRVATSKAILPIQAEINAVGSGNKKRFTVEESS